MLYMDRNREGLVATQSLFGRVLLHVPQSSPRLATQAALGLSGMKWRIWEEKILLVLAIWGQEYSCLAIPFQTLLMNM